ncbi:hypothetical protein [Nonomuraea soli]|uniref:Replicase polyprotein 1ab n=1 Tax=Nonomuraea soli TaxID=1032476 RepID=A0A7W0HUF5_9ACTN|nr:hypothetical protein [Nonomuraea soli]MBA2895912.1 hypothetical protein [Nonomuraea soli]
MRDELRSLPGDLADLVGRHLVAAERALADDDPEKAHEHVKVARRFAARLGVVREAAGIVAYRAGHYAEALSDLRAARRLTGSDAYLPVMADCERGLGRPERALDLVKSREAERLDRAGHIELAIVESGARRDLGQHDAAVITLQRLPELRDPQPRPWSARLAYAYADALAEAGHQQAAVDWFARAAAFDEDGETDAADRHAELTGAFIEDIEEDFDEDLDEDADVDLGDVLASDATEDDEDEDDDEERDVEEIDDRYDDQDDQGEDQDDRYDDDRDDDRDEDDQDEDERDVEDALDGDDDRETGELDEDLDDEYDAYDDSDEDDSDDDERDEDFDDSDEDDDAADEDEDEDKSDEASVEADAPVDDDRDISVDAEQSKVKPSKALDGDIDAEADEQRKRGVTPAFIEPVYGDVLDQPAEDKDKQQDEDKGDQH